VFFYLISKDEEPYYMKQIIWLIVATVLMKSFALSQLTNSNTDLSSINLTAHTTNNQQPDETTAAKVKDYEQYPEHWQGDRLVEIARAYMAQKDYPKAEVVYQLVLVKSPDNTRAIRGLGYAYLFTQNYDIATKTFKRGWSLGDGLSLLALANTYYAMGHFQDIAPLVTDLLKHQKLYTENNDQHEALNALVSYSLKADSPIGTNVFLKAIDGIADSFILEREDTKALIICALETFGYQGRLNQLKDEMDNRLIQIESTFNAGLAKINRGDYAGAAADFTKVIEADSKRGRAYSELARSQCRLSQYHESITNFTKAIELGQQTWDNYCSRGISKQVVGDIIGSLDDFKRTVELNPQYGDGYTGLALAQYYIFASQSALENFRKGLQYGASFPNTQAYIWLIRSRLGEKVEATKELTVHVKSISAGEIDAWSNVIDRYLIGELSEDTFFQKAKDTAPTFGKVSAQLCQAYYFSGMKHFFDGDKAGAVGLLQKAVDISVSKLEYFNAKTQLHVMDLGGN
jgi:tetratricopeptide (TPR) repeat protein